MRAVTTTRWHRTEDRDPSALPQPPQRELPPRPPRAPAERRRSAGSAAQPSPARPGPAQPGSAQQRQDLGALRAAPGDARRGGGRGCPACRGGRRRRCPPASRGWARAAPGRGRSGAACSAAWRTPSTTRRWISPRSAPAGPAAPAPAPVPARPTGTVPLSLPAAPAGPRRRSAARGPPPRESRPTAAAR